MPSKREHAGKLCSYGYLTAVARCCSVRTVIDAYINNPQNHPEFNGIAERSARPGWVTFLVDNVHVARLDDVPLPAALYSKHGYILVRTRYIEAVHLSSASMRFSRKHTRSMPKSVGLAGRTAKMRYSGRSTTGWEAMLPRRPSLQRVWHSWHALQASWQSNISDG
jgi:hypothetical protein